MSVPIKLKITKAGIAALFDARANGLKLELETIKYSSDNFESVVMDNRTALNNIVFVSYIAASGVSINSQTIRFVSVINSSQDLRVGSLGVFTKQGVLFAVASVAAGDLLKVFTGISFSATFGLAVNATALETLNIVTDQNAALAYAMILDHERHDNPHPQYAKQAAVNQSITNLQNSINNAIGNTGNLSGQLVGIGQVYRNLLNTQRFANGTVYRNNTPKPIFVVITVNLSDGRSACTIMLGTEVVASVYGHQSNGTLGVDTVVSFMVPPNATYSANGGYVARWVEQA